MYKKGILISVVIDLFLLCSVILLLMLSIGKADGLINIVKNFIENVVL